MTVKVLNEERVKQCERCHALLSFTFNDIVFGHGDSWIKCPDCQENTYIHRQDYVHSVIDVDRK